MNGRAITGPAPNWVLVVILPKVPQDEHDLTNVRIESLHFLTVFIEWLDITDFEQKFKKPDMVSRKLLLSFVLAYDPAYIVNIKTKTLA